MGRLAAQAFHERDNERRLDVVVSGERDGELRGGWIEALLCDECAAFGEPLFQQRRESGGTGRRQDSALGAYEQRIGEDLAQSREHRAHGRLREREPFRCARHALLLEQRVERDQQVQVDASDIFHVDASAARRPLIARRIFGARSRSPRKCSRLR